MAATDFFKSVKKDGLRVPWSVLGKLGVVFLSLFCTYSVFLLKAEISKQLPEAVHEALPAVIAVVLSNDVNAVRTIIQPSVDLAVAAQLRGAENEFIVKVRDESVGKEDFKSFKDNDFKELKDQVRTLSSHVQQQSKDLNVKLDLRDKDINAKLDARDREIGARLDASNRILVNLDKNLAVLAAQVGRKIESSSNTNQ